MDKQHAPRHITLVRAMGYCLKQVGSIAAPYISLTGLMFVVVGVSSANLRGSWEVFT